MKLSPEFSSALKKILQVSKSDMNRMLEEERRANAGKPKRGPKPKASPSGRAAENRD